MNRPGPARVNPATMAVRRRSAAERRVLALLRSEDAGKADPALSPIRIHFVLLRRSAATVGLVIQLPDVPYVSDDEMLLLGWIAKAQRVTNYAVDMPHDSALVAAIKLCAELLNTIGVRLGPLTVYAASRTDWRHRV